VKPGRFASPWRLVLRAAWRVACVCAATAALLITVYTSPPASAHASLLSTLPAEGLTLTIPPETFRLDFNEPVSPLVMRLVLPSGQVVNLANVVAQNNSVTVAAPAMPDQGSYVLSWRVISADGHPVGGVVTFAVGHPSSGVRAPPAAGAAAVHAAIWAMQFVLSFALFIGVGGAFFVAWLAAKRPLPRQGLLVAAMTCGIIGAAASIPLQGLDALAQPLREAWRPGIWAAGFATSWGSTVLLAVAALVAGLLALGLDHRPLARALALLALLGVGLALLASGHASTAEPRLLSAAAVFVHGVTIAFWIGSLLPLAIAVRGGDRVALERFSRLIPLPLLALIASGIALSFVQLDRPDALWTTDYGRVLTAKIAVVLVLLALATLNRYALVPRLAMTGTRRLVTVIATEFALAVVILGLVGLWRFMPPPRALAAAETTFIHFHAERAMAQINLTPERDRGASVSIDVTDSDLHPVAAKEVDLVIWNPGAGIEPIRSSATFEGGARWRIVGLHIPVAGVWRMRVEILISDFDKVMIEDNVELPRAP
jgi:copper transport protein